MEKNSLQYAKYFERQKSKTEINFREESCVVGCVCRLSSI